MTFTFRLAAAGRVVFTVTEVWPACRVEGTFVVRGHRGVNLVAFTARLRGRMLPAGTYRISARVPGGGQRLLVATVVVVGSGSPPQAALEAALHSDVCATRATLAASRVLGVAAAAAPTRMHTSGTRQGKSSDRVSGGVAGASHTQASGYTTTDATGRVSDPLVIAALVAAVLLLGTAALPYGVMPSARLNLAVMNHRVALATMGAAALFAAIVAFAFS